MKPSPAAYIVYSWHSFIVRLQSDWMLTKYVNESRDLGKTVDAQADLDILERSG